MRLNCQKNSIIVKSLQMKDVHFKSQFYENIISRKLCYSEVGCEIRLQRDVVEE